MARNWNLPLIHEQPFASIADAREVAVVYTNPARDAVADRIHIRPVWQAEVTEATTAHWDAISADLRGDVVYAIGGGLAVDAAKYIASRHNLPLVCLPTALSVDAFLTWASGYRHDGCVYYLETKPPDELIIDYEVLAAAPVTVRAAGICDTLSIATGLWDWRYAEEHGKNPPGMEHIPYIEATARAILQGSLDAAEAAGRGDPDGLRHLLHGLALEVQMCDLIGHSRPEEGSEHYFAYAVENVMGKGLPHGDLVGPGIVLLASIQGQDVRPLKQALQACQIPLNSIPDDVIRQTLRQLPNYSRHHGLPYGIAHDLIEAHLQGLPSL